MLNSGKRLHAVRAADTGAVYRTGDHHRAVRPFGAGRHVQRVDAVVEIRRVADDVSRESIHVKRAGFGINHRGAGDADFGHNIRVTATGVAIAEWRGRAVGRQADIVLPQNAVVRAQITVGVERVDRVVLGRHENHVVNALAGNRHIRHDQRFGIDVTVHGVGKQFAKCVGVHVCGRQPSFVDILPLARVVVMIRQHRHRRHERTRRERSETRRRLRPRRAGGVRRESGEIISRVRRQPRDRRAKISVRLAN